MIIYFVYEKGYSAFIVDADISVEIERISRKEGSGFLEREINRTGRKRILKIRYTSI